jgi:UDP-N-acetylglucosamine--N-acetylmuramyl-(pentapeptide) pyrophosphoryl-undecaprenol N-acetylglucosamine transferase
MPAQPHVVFAGGGTAGHVVPALAVAAELRRRWPGLRMTLVGTGRKFESALAAGGGLEYAAVRSRALPRRPREAWRFLFDNVTGYYSARWLLAAQRASLVVGLGGYASAAICRAAIAAHVPLVLVEPNAVPGRVVRWLASKAAVVCTAFDDAAERLPRGCRVVLTGTPVRGEFFTKRKPTRGATAGLSSSGSSGPPFRAARPARRLVVLGGSGGSGLLNEAVPRAVYHARTALAGWQVIHQAGRRDDGATAVLYRKLGLAATVVPFIDDLARVLATADLAVTRAGGSTLAELCAAAVPSIVVPLANSADGHQRANAEALARARACHLVEERFGNQRLDKRLAEELAQLAASERQRAAMAAAAHRASKPQAAAAVAELIVRQLGSVRSRVA